MWYRSRVVVTLVLWVLASLATETVRAQNTTNEPSLRVYRSRQWLVQETSNFRVFCLPEMKEAVRLPRVCEDLRQRLHETWLTKAAGAWSPKCDVFVHPSVAEYSRILGPGSEQSSGCATLEIEAGRVVGRRIDLRADASDCFDCSLPHELTHVVVAERFTHRRIPRWIDEGMAILAEPRPKQDRRRRALADSLKRNRPFQALELTALPDYPPLDRRDIFYGQSASLVAYLMERESPARFVEFAELSTQIGAEPALARVYGVGSWAELEGDWRSRMLVPGESAELLAADLRRIAAGRDMD